MGTYECTELCRSNINDNDLLKEPKKNDEDIISIKDKKIIYIQSYYRGYKSRMKFKKAMTKHHKLKKKKIVNKEPQIYVKENWEFFFKFKQKYDFSLLGIQTLKTDIDNFYADFFKGEFNSNLINPMRQTIHDLKHLQTLTKESIENEKDCTSDCVSNNSDNQRLKIFTEERIRSIKSSNDFLNNFKEYFLAVLNEKYELGELRENFQGMKFEFCSIKQQNNLEIEIGAVNYLEVPGLPKEKLIEDGKPFITTIIEDIDNYEKNSCSFTSFKDNNNINYIGCVKEDTNLKWGLGKEYFVEPKLATLDRFKHCGYFKKGLYHGLGMHIQENNECYYGEYRDGYRHGFGILDTSFYTYKGFFYKNKFEGYGEYSKTKFYYCGNFHEGLFDGFGFMETDANSICVGYFQKGKVNGEAYYKWNSGQIYYGSWVDGKMHGFGEYLWKNGDKYEGYYENDLRHGKGIYQFHNGSVLKGTWVKGKKEGLFTLNVINDDEKMNMKKGIYYVKYSNDYQIK